MDKHNKYFEIIEMEMSKPKKVPFLLLLRDITPIEYMSMRPLADYEREHGGQRITVNALAAATGMPVSQMSRTLKHLEARSLVKRITDEECRRSTFVEVSELGRKIFDRNTEIIMNFASRILSTFSDSEIDLMISFKKRMLAETEKAMAEFKENNNLGKEVD